MAARIAAKWTRVNFAPALRLSGGNGNPEIVTGVDNTKTTHFATQFLATAIVVVITVIVTIIVTVITVGISACPAFLRIGPSRSPPMAADS